MRRFLLAAALGFALSACNKAELPPGLSFVSEGSPSIVLNEQAGQWRVFVDGVDMTQRLGLTAKPLEGSPYNLVQVEIARPTEVFPGSFSLQYRADVQYGCTGTCPGGQKIWRLKKS